MLTCAAMPESVVVLVQLQSCISHAFHVRTRRLQRCRDTSKALEAKLCVGGMGHKVVLITCVSLASMAGVQHLDRGLMYRDEEVCCHKYAKLVERVPCDDRPRLL